MQCKYITDIVEKESYKPLVERVVIFEKNKIPTPTLPEGDGAKIGLFCISKPYNTKDITAYNIVYLKKYFTLKYIYEKNSFY